MAVLVVYPEGRTSFDLPRELLPEGARSGDVFVVRFEKDAGETGRTMRENRRMLDELLGRDG